MLSTKLLSSCTFPFKNLSSHYVVEVNEQCENGSTPFSIVMAVSLTVNRVDSGGMEYYGRMKM